MIWAAIRDTLSRGAVEKPTYVCRVEAAGRLDRVIRERKMRLSSKYSGVFGRPKALTPPNALRHASVLTLLTVSVVVALQLSVARAEPQATDLDLSLPPTGLDAQPQPVYPNGAPKSGRDGGAESDPTETAEQETPEPADDERKAATSEDEDKAVEPPKPVIVANVDKGRQQMTVFVDGVETYTWPVSTGIAGYSSPTGEFTASSMNKIWYSRQWDNAPMPHAVFFTKRGHAIHGTNEVKKLGSPASKGCVRLSPKNAETFFNLVKESGLKNTKVVMTGVTPGGEYKITEPRRRDQLRPRGYYDRNGVYRRYGYVEPRVERKRRRLFQPYYNSPPRQYQRQQRRRWFRKPGY